MSVTNDTPKVSASYLTRWFFVHFIPKRMSARPMPLAVGSRADRVPNGLCQFRSLELGHIAVGARVSHVRLICRAGKRRMDYDGDIPCAFVRPDTPRQREAIHFGHLQVGEHHRYSITQARFVPLCLVGQLDENLPRFLARLGHDAFGANVAKRLLN